MKGLPPESRQGHGPAFQASHAADRRDANSRDGTGIPLREVMVGALQHVAGGEMEWKSDEGAMFGMDG